ncbi:hypothetical protein [Oceanobacillus neutriphilus]|uniref:Uncharacterized protein n=1 Tax=Oceanobacillus neutriphilus TaxID=531815 RepID=A0ABQ2NP40_9BACI|nr:hypothetical protein [Oceanobacillus neutriphilus]GGP07252.1 hypothetical protein GCM10011346_02490 [Oceanobacillus neutriphilus]
MIMYQKANKWVAEERASADSDRKRKIIRLYGKTKDEVAERYKEKKVIEIIRKMNSENLTVERQTPLPGVDILVVSENGCYPVMVPTKLVITKTFESILNEVLYEIARIKKG